MQDHHDFNAYCRSLAEIEQDKRVGGGTGSINVMRFVGLGLFVGAVALWAYDMQTGAADGVLRKIQSSTSAAGDAAGRNLLVLSLPN